MSAPDCEHYIIHGICRECRRIFLSAGPREVHPADAMMRAALERLLTTVEPCGCYDTDDCPHPNRQRFTAGADAAIPEIRAALAEAVSQ